MKSITYIGVHDEVIIPSLGIRCANGQTIEVEDDQAADSLLAQGSYPEHLATDGETVVPARAGTEWRLAKASPSGAKADAAPITEAV